MAVGALPRNPYTVGGPVRGLHFYGRTALIQTILDGNDRSIWVVGNRRIGKTSLLLRLEQLGNVDGRVAFMISLD
ncbi:MAG: ATP-binding protein, partial [Chloroflexota bacterium]|nr:ATP-binding protein [Chloroflexota bacterium]